MKALKKLFKGKSGKGASQPAGCNAPAGPGEHGSPVDQQAVGRAAQPDNRNAAAQFGGPAPGVAEAGPGTPPAVEQATPGDGTTLALAAAPAAASRSAELASPLDHAGGPAPSPDATPTAAGLGPSTHNLLDRPASRGSLDGQVDYTHDGTLDECCDFGAGPLELGGAGGGGQEGGPADPEDFGSCSAGLHGGEEAGSGGERYDGSSGCERAGDEEHGGGSGGGASPSAAGLDAGGGGGGEPPISDALSTMVYLTEEGEAAGEDAISVLSDGMTEEELAEELSELEQALSALEGEAVGGASPGGFSPGGSVLDRQLAEKLGLADDDGSDPAAYAKQMVKLYTNLGLKLMDSRKFDDALTMMRKAEAMVDNDELWGPSPSPNPNPKRKRLQAITYNNLGCLFKRMNHPQVALQYLMRALALEEETGHVQNSSSTHLNICAAYSSLKKYKESLNHAERAIVLLQRQLWAPTASFQDGLLHLTKVLATAGDRKLLSAVNVLAIAYHNAALEHERLGRVREAHVCFTRASTLAMKCLGPRAVITNSLQRALKAFLARHQQSRGRGGGSTPRAGSGASAQVKVRQTSPKRGTRVGGASLRPPAGPRTTSRSALAASSAKATLPLDKSGRAFGKEARSGSSGKLSDHSRRG